MYGIYYTYNISAKIVNLLYAVTSSNSARGSSPDSSATIIGGAMGGVILLLMVTVVLCTVILCSVRSHRKKAHYKISYDTNRPNIIVNNSVIRLDSDVPMTINPSYGLPIKRCNEEEYNYVQPDEPFIYSDESVKMESNPSYRVITGEDRETTFSTYSDAEDYHSLRNITIKQDDYDYVRNDHFLNRNTVTDTTTNAKQDNTDDTSYLAIVN